LHNDSKQGEHTHAHNQTAEENQPIEGRFLMLPLSVMPFAMGSGNAGWVLLCGNKLNSQLRCNFIYLPTSAFLDASSTGFSGMGWLGYIWK
jgi:hypothetical protein